MKSDKETDEEGKKRGLSMERSKAGTKKSSNSLSQHNKNKIIIRIKYYFIRYGKGAIQLTKNKWSLTIEK